MDNKELNIENKEIDLSMIEDALSPDVSEEDAAQFQLMGDKVY
ncbi:hypothetical protein [Saliterribacillus persicus]|uniref:Uncharacterized protein n=1 Tax=Saliterribacillus persicus TaxID=930114 RepID=A0A368XFU8_9BACI|nr:hypothetical protein [Saliterribacillus persicus]RCW65898.1 hypothetical protein DFR57_110116 [Saliterribacillus persicus]